MKCFAAICILITLAAAEEYIVKNRDNLFEYREACVKELNISNELVEKYKKWEYPNDALTQCYLKCVFIKFGLFDLKNGFNVENVHKQLANGAEITHNEELHQQIDSCIDKNEQGSNACEWAYRGATCLLKNNLQLIQQSLVPKA